MPQNMYSAASLIGACGLVRINIPIMHGVRLP